MIWIDNVESKICDLCSSFTFTFPFPFQAMLVALHNVMLEGKIV